VSHDAASAEIGNRQDHPRATDVRFAGGEHIAVEPGGGVLQVVLNHQLIVTPTGDLVDLVDNRDEDTGYHRGDGQNH